MTEAYITRTMDKIGEVFESTHNVLVLTHVGPDGDALGSLTAIGQAMAHLDKDVVMVVEEGVSDRFAYLPMADKVRDSVPRDIDFDLLIAVDCGDAERMGDAYNSVRSQPIVINIDHHVTNTNFGRFNLVPASVASTCEVLVDLFNHLNYEITQEMAVSLLTGIVTDTLCFRTSNTTPNTLKIASTLIEAGAELQPIVTNALNMKPFNTLRMWGEGFNHMKLEAGVIWTAISRDARTRSGFEGGSSAGMANLLSEVEEAACAAVLIELDDGRISISMRSRPPFDVSGVALELGGGGHAQAAGAALELPLEDAAFEVVRRLKGAVAAQKALMKKEENKPG